jgi:hypothetical protein
MIILRAMVVATIILRELLIARYDKHLAISRAIFAATKLRDKWHSVSFILLFESTSESKGLNQINSIS